MQLHDFVMSYPVRLRTMKLRSLGYGCSALALLTFTLIYLQTRNSTPNELVPIPFEAQNLVENTASAEKLANTQEDTRAATSIEKSQLNDASLKQNPTSGAITSEKPSPNCEPLEFTPPEIVSVFVAQEGQSYISVIATDTIRTIYSGDPLAPDWKLNTVESLKVTWMHELTKCRKTQFMNKGSSRQ